jgi:hypothetical protein
MPLELEKKAEIVGKYKQHDRDIGHVALHKAVGDGGRGHAKDFTAATVSFL